MMLIGRSQWVERAWRNGAGRSFAIWTGGAGEPGGLQVFRTPISHAAPFSDYSGHDRVFVLLQGGQLDLTLDGQTQRLRPRGVVRFTGETAVQAELPSGPVEVLNVIIDRKRWREARDGETADLVIAHMLGTVPGHALAEGDTTVSAAPPAGHPDLIEIWLVQVA